MDGIEVSGFEDILGLTDDMSFTETDEKRAMKMAIEPVGDEVEKNTPVRTNRLKKSVKRIVKKEGFATVGIIRMNEFYDIFEEFGTSQSKKNVGFFEKSISKTEDKVIDILSKQLLK